MLFPSLWRAALAGAATCAALAALTIPAQAAVVPAGPGPSGSSFGFTVAPPPGVAAARGSVPSSLKAPGSAGAPPRQLFVPDLIAAAPAGISPAQLARISKLAGVRKVLSVDGGKVTVNGVIPGTVLIDGFVAGMWRLDRRRDAAAVTIEIFGREGPPGSAAERDALAAEAGRVLAFAAPGAAHHVRFAPLGS